MNQLMLSQGTPSRCREGLAGREGNLWRVAEEGDGECH